LGIGLSSWVPRVPVGLGALDLRNLDQSGLLNDPSARQGIFLEFLISEVGFVNLLPTLGA
jgi:hypothetical protein